MVPYTPAPPRTLLRYVAFQVPGAVIAAIVLALLHEQAGLPAGLAGLLFFLWLANDAALYPFLRRAYELSDTAHDRLVGERARVVPGFTASGFVRLRGELWRAELLEGEAPVADDDLVTVQGARRLTLMIYRPPEEALPKPAGTTRQSGEAHRPEPPSARSPVNRGPA